MLVSGVLAFEPSKVDIFFQYSTPKHTFPNVFPIFAHKMVEFQSKIEALRGYLDGGEKRVAIVTHTNPDGDAIGSALAWAETLRGWGHTVQCLVPNRFPSFLDWMEGIGEVIIAKEATEEAIEAITSAELIFVMDLNKIDRLDSMTEPLEASSAPRILIDHHLMPPDDFSLRAHRRMSDCRACCALLGLRSLVLRTAISSRHISFVVCL